jgi:uncharacterized protein
MRNLLLLILYLSFMATLDTNAQPAVPAPAATATPMQTYSFRLRPGQDLKGELDALVQLD